jgi:PhoD-like phosphatase
MHFEQYQVPLPSSHWHSTTQMSRPTGSNHCWASSSKTPLLSRRNSTIPTTPRLAKTLKSSRARSARPKPRARFGSCGLVRQIALFLLRFVLSRVLTLLICCCASGNTQTATSVAPDYSRAHEVVNATLAPIVKAYFDALLAGTSGGAARAYSAMAMTNTPYNSDGMDGFAVERAAILKVAKDDANNAVILGGDLHDLYAWSVNEGRNMTGNPVAINLVCPGVTYTGFGTSAWPLMAGLEVPMGGRDNVFEMFHALWRQTNPSLKYTNGQFRGFFAVKATKKSHHTEYFHFRPETIASNFSSARSESGKNHGKLHLHG